MQARAAGSLVDADDAAAAAAVAEAAEARCYAHKPQRMCAVPRCLRRHLVATRLIISPAKQMPATNGATGNKVCMCVCEFDCLCVYGYVICMSVLCA